MTNNIVLIVWRDAACNNGWNTREECEFSDEDTLIETVGWIVIDKTEGISIVQSKGKQDVRLSNQFINVQFIPRDMIIEIKDLTAISDSP